MRRILQLKKALRAALFVLLLNVVGMTKADPVGMSTVREVAMKFMNANTNAPLRSVDDLQLVTTYSISRGDAAFYLTSTAKILYFSYRLIINHIRYDVRIFG